MKIDLRADLTVLKAEMAAKIDEEAERMRGLFLTLGAGQAMVYLEKRAEAEAYMADPTISPSLIPHLSNEAAALDLPVFDVAVDVLTRAEVWKTASSLIESARIAAKEAVRAGTTARQVRDAAVVDWGIVLQSLM